MQGAVDPAGFPGQGIDPDAVETAAGELQAAATTIRDSGAQVVAEWRALPASYEAPEAELLFAAMTPVERDTLTFADDLDVVAGALRTYTADVRPILTALDSAADDARMLRRELVGQHDWRADEVLLGRNELIRRAVNTQAVALWDAERRCANTIRALVGGFALRASTGEGDPLGYGWTEIGRAPMPWGAPVEYQVSCPRSAAMSMIRMQWHGFVFDGVGGTLLGAAALVGFDGEEWSLENARATWVGLHDLLAPWSGMSGDSRGAAWQEVGRGLVSWDQWDNDPARAAGATLFNVGSVLVPVAGVTAAALKVGGRAGRAASALGKANRVLDALDPVSWVSGAVRALPGVGDLAAVLRGAAAGVTDAALAGLQGLTDRVRLAFADLPSTLDDAPAGAARGGSDEVGAASRTSLDEQIAPPARVVDEVGDPPPTTAGAPDPETPDAPDPDVPEADMPEPDASDGRGPQGEGSPDAGPSHTQPSSAPDPDAKPRGPLTTWTPRDDAETARGRGRENEAAGILARLGFDVEQNPVVPGDKEPDYRIEGEIFDCMAPRTDTARSIWTTAEGKVMSKQADRLVIYLDDTPISLEALRVQFRYPIAGLKEILILRDGQLIRFFPFPEEM